MEQFTDNANNIFEQPWWLDTVSEGSWDEAIIEEKGHVVARLPFVKKKTWWGNKIVMPILTQTIGPWIYKFNTNGNEHLSQQKDILSNLIDNLPRNKYFKLHLSSEVEYILPFIWKGFNVKPCYTYRISNLNDLERVYSNFNNTVKKNIRSAEKKVIIRDDLDIQVLINMMDITFKSQGRKYPISGELIKKIHRNCIKYNAGKLLAAQDNDGNIHACSLFVYDSNVCYYLISGSDTEFRSSGAQSLIIWEAIKFASTVSKVFDFEGSMIEGIERFFRHFGGKPTLYYEIRKIPIIFELFELMKPKIKRFLKYKQ